MMARVAHYLAGSGLGPFLVKAVAGTAGLRIVGMVFTFLVGVQLARGLGAEGYGIYGVAMSVIALLTVPTEFGLPQLLTREVATAHVRQDWKLLHGVLRWAARSVMLLSLLVAALVVAWLIISGKGLGTSTGMTVLAGLAMVPMVALSNLKGAALRALRHVVKGQLSDTLIRPMTFSALLFLLPILFAPLTPLSAMLAGVASAAIGYVVAHRMLLRVVMPVGDLSDIRVDSRGWWASAFPMAMTEGMRTIQGNAAILVMGALAAEAAVGIFRVSLAASGIISLPVTLFLLVGAPVISRLYAEGDMVRLQRLLGWLAGGMTIGSVLLTLPFLAGGGWLLGRIFGQEFAMANTPLLILCLGGVLFSMLGPAVILLNMTGHERRVTRAFVISVAVLLVAAVPLVSLYGGVGAATANVLGMWVGALLMWRDGIRLLKLDCSILSLAKEWSAP